jgi:hypothetical protein
MVELLNNLQPGASVQDLCDLGDKLLADLCKPIRKKKLKDNEKGIAFPTCISVNHCAGNFSPLSDDPIVKLKGGDVVKMYVMSLRFLFRLFGFFFFFVVVFVRSFSSCFSSARYCIGVVLLIRWCSFSFGFYFANRSDLLATLAPTSRASLARVRTPTSCRTPPPTRHHIRAREPTSFARPITRQSARCTC